MTSLEYPPAITKQECQQLESLACGAIVHQLGGARLKAARSVKAWRKFGDRERAAWALRHFHFITDLRALKPGQS